MASAAPAVGSSAGGSSATPILISVGWANAGAVASIRPARASARPLRAIMGILPFRRRRALVMSAQGRALAQGLFGLLDAFDLRPLIDQIGRYPEAEQ